MPTITYSQSTAPTVIDHPLGPPGKSAYQSWLDTGHTGTEQDFMDWLAAGGGGGADLSDDPALPLAATAAAGIGTEASRDDHVHPLPTAAQVGADAAGTATAAVAAHEAEADPHPQYATAAEAAAAAPVQSVAGRTGAVTLTTADVGGLGTAATHAHGDYDLAGAATAAQSAAQTYTDNAVSSAVVGLLDDRGGYDASGNVFPSTGGSGGGGAVLKGDLWTVSVAGTLGGTAVTAGDVVRALVDAPGQTASNWAVTENNLGYVPEPAQTLVTQPEAEAGTDTNRKAWTVQRVWQAIAAWWAASSAKTKLDGIAAGATVGADWNANVSNKPALGTAAAKNVPASGDAAAGEVVLGNDSRLIVSIPDVSGMVQDVGLHNYGTYGHFHALTYGSENIAIGSNSAGELTTGQHNVLLGNSAGAHVTTGHDNTCIGHSAGGSLTDGYSNVLIGTNAGGSAVSGWGITCLGDLAGSYSAAGNGDTCVGYNTYTSGGGNETAIGGGAYTSAANTVAIGNASVTLVETHGQLKSLGSYSSAVAGAANLVIGVSGDISRSTATTVTFTSVPAASSATGTPGQISADSDYFYVCVATNSWIRIAKGAW